MFQVKIETLSGCERSGGIRSGACLLHNPKSVLMKTPTTYRPVQILLHWAIALLFLALFVFENSMGRALRTVLNGGTVSYTRRCRLLRPMPCIGGCTR